MSDDRPAVAGASLPVTVGRDSVRIGERFELALQRTLRVPEDGNTYPLPPGLGRLPLLPAGAAAGPLPAEWRESGDVLAPLYQREALWLALGGAAWKPNAVQIGVGSVNAISGGSWDEGLSDDPQNYVVVPEQPWLDGINSGAGSVRQFVAVPLGSGRTVEGQLHGSEQDAALQIRVYEPRPGVFPDAEPERRPAEPARMGVPAMGLGAGGAIRQKLYPDPHGLDVWDPGVWGSARIRILNSERWAELTGQSVPPTPVTAAVYSEHGFPWFELYDEELGDVAPSARFEGLEGTGSNGEASTPVDPARIEGIRRGQDR